jgi:hypothetical protein
VSKFGRIYRPVEANVTGEIRAVQVVIYKAQSRSLGPASDGSGFQNVQAEPQPVGIKWANNQIYSVQKSTA